MRNAATQRWRTVAQSYDALAQSSQSSDAWLRTSLNWIDSSSWIDSSNWIESSSLIETYTCYIYINIKTQKNTKIPQIQKIQKIQKMQIMNCGNYVYNKIENLFVYFPLAPNGPPGFTGNLFFFCFCHYVCIVSFSWFWDFSGFWLPFGVHLNYCSCYFHIFFGACFLIAPFSFVHGLGTLNPQSATYCQQFPKVTLSKNNEFPMISGAILVLFCNHCWCFPVMNF